MADFDLEAFKKMTPKEKMALAKKYTPEQIAKFQEQLADEDLDDMDYGVPTGMVEEEEEEFVYNERAWIDEHGVYRTPEAWKDPGSSPRTPRTGASGRYSAARTTRYPKFPEGNYPEDLVKWEDWKDAPTQIPEELLPRKCPEPTVDWERDP
ncbi:hypothetical protein JL720_9870 [Aureococcus anophagefferens]|nr:hypothetical protein JL720_9870 [Aureococcus anophagefferens]